MDVRIPFLVYGLLYVLVELVGARLEEIGWPQLTALDVATAVVHSVFTVCVGVAVLLGVDVVIRHWRRSRAAWHAGQAHLAAEAEPETITVQAWRAEPLALPAGSAGGPFTGPDYSTRDDGALPLYVPSEILDRDGRRL
ncbi:hypothetical protein ACI8AF_21440 [Blastococcus sp. SYSU D00669]